MPRLMVFSHSGFSDSEANGITMKNLLSAFSPQEKAEFYMDVQPADHSAAHRYFRVTDAQMVKAFLGKKSRHIFEFDPNAETSAEKKSGSSPKKIPVWLKKQKYNFAVKWLREQLWAISPWGHRRLEAFIDEFRPDALVYMVGESIFLDKLVLKTCDRLQVPLVLYNGEAFRIIDLKTRRGLERAYYRRVEKLYERLSRRAAMVIYNCEMLREDYEARYPHCAQAMVAYNSARCDHGPYQPGDEVSITYFGNLGVGRSDELLRVARVLSRIDPALRLDIYGNALPEAAEAFSRQENIRYHGFVDAAALHGIVEKSDILLHVESFDETIIPKLKYAFSTKIAQCLCAGRCFVSFAPQGSASSRYLQNAQGAALVSDEAQLEQLLRELVADPALRQSYAQKAAATGRANHDMQTTAARVRREMEGLLHG